MLGETWEWLSVGLGFLGWFGDSPVIARVLPVNFDVCAVDFNVISWKDVVRYVLRLRLEDGAKKLGRVVLEY